MAQSEDPRAPRDPGTAGDDLDERIAAAREAIAERLRQAAAEAERGEAELRAHAADELAQVAGVELGRALGELERRGRRVIGEVEARGAGEVARARRRLLEAETGAVESAARAHRSAELAAQAEELVVRFRAAARAEARAAGRMVAAERRLLSLVRRG